MLAAVLFLAIASATWFLLQRSGAATALCRSALSSVLAAPFQLSGAQIELLDGRLSVQGFALTDPSREGHNLIAIDNVRLTIETDPSRGLLAVHDLTIEGAHIDVDLTPGHTPRLTSILQPAPLDASDRPAQHAATEVTPVLLTNSEIRLRIGNKLPDLRIVDLELRLQRNLQKDGSKDLRHGSIKGHARLANFDLEVDLRGDLDLASGRARIEASVDEAAIDERLLQSLLQFAKTDMPANAIRGKLRHLLLWCDLNFKGGEPPVLGTSFELEDVDTLTQWLPVPLRGVSLIGKADTRDNGTALVTATRMLPEGESEVVAKVTGLLTTMQIEVRGKGRDIVIDETVTAALRSFPAGFAVVDGLRPTTGRADFDLYLRDPGAPTEIIDLDLGLKGVALSYNGFGAPETRVRFPLPIVNASGHVHLRDEMLSIEDVTAQLAPEAGGGEVRMTGRVDTSHEHLGDVWIDLSTPQLNFTPSLRASLSTLVRDNGTLYDQFQPKGAAAVQLQVRPENDPDGQWQVRIQALGCALTWAGFPFTLHDVQGTVIARSDGMVLDLFGRRDAAAIQVKGQLQSPVERPGALTSGSIDLRIRATAVPLDQELHTALVKLAPDIETIWTKLSPTGNCDADLTVRRPHGDAEMSYDLAMQLAGGTARADSLPMKITDLHGDLFVHGIGKRLDVQVDALRGRLQEQSGSAAELALLGIVNTHPIYQEDFTAVVRKLQLDPELGRALEQSGAVSRGTWNVLRPGGIVDLVCRQNRTGDAEPKRDYTVLMHNVQSNAEMLPQPATNVSGELEIRDGELSFRDVRAKIGKSTVTCSSGRVGASTTLGRNEVSFRISAEQFPLNDDFARLFVGPMRQAVLDRQLRGTANIQDLSLTFLLPTNGSDQPIETVFQGRVEALDVEALVGTRLQSIYGVIDLEESHITNEGGSLRGQFTQGSMKILGHACKQAQAEFEADAEQFRLRKLTISMNGGQLSGSLPDAHSLTYRFAKSPTEPGSLSTDLQISGISLNDFLNDCGLVDTPYTGTLKGNLKLNDLRGNDLLDLDVNGALEVTDGNLGPVPLFTSLYAQMEERNRPRFDQLSVTFKTKDRALELSKLQVTSPMVAVNGEGTLSLDGYLDIVLATKSLFGGNADYLVVPWMLKWATNLVRFHMYGHLRDLRTKQRFVTQRDPRRPALTPIPSRVATPNRLAF